MINTPILSRGVPNNVYMCVVHIHAVLYVFVCLCVSHREKQLLNSALDYLSQHEVLVKNGSIPFQLELKIKEREESDAREAEQRAFVEEVGRFISLFIIYPYVPRSYSMVIACVYVVGENASST